jgi:hypothetical protein
LDVQQVIAWLRRLVALDARVFEEVRSNPGATIPGVLIVTVATFIAGLGGWLWWVVQDFGNNGDILVHSALVGSAIAVVLWGLVWLGLVYVILTQVFRERAYVEQLLRVMGLAASPLALMGLMFIPAISFGIGLTALALSFGLTNIGIQTVTTANPLRVLVANFCGFFVWACVLTLLASASFSRLEPHAPGVFLYNATTSLTQDLVDLGEAAQEFLR